MLVSPCSLSYYRIRPECTIQHTFEVTDEGSVAVCTNPTLWGPRLCHSHMLRYKNADSKKEKRRRSVETIVLCLRLWSNSVESVAGFGLFAVTCTMNGSPRKSTWIHRRGGQSEYSIGLPEVIDKSCARALFAGHHCP